MILGSRAAEGAPFTFHVTMGRRVSHSPLKGAFLSDLTVSERGSRATDLDAFFCAFSEVLLVILVFKAIEGALFASQATLGLNVRVERRRDMI